MAKAKTSNMGLLAVLAAVALTRFKVVKNTAGTAGYIDSVADVPFGVLVDGTDAAGEEAVCGVLGKGETKVGKCSGAVAMGKQIVPAVDGSGDIRALPASGAQAVTYWVIGLANIEAGEDDQEMAYTDCVPFQVTVPALPG